MAVFWVLGDGRLDDGGSTDLENVRNLIPVCTAPQPRRQPSSYQPLWEPQIVLIVWWDFPFNAIIVIFLRVSLGCVIMYFM
jgi:hypothetical protein